jgi:hypothetical protein
MEHSANYPALKRRYVDNANPRLLSQPSPAPARSSSLRNDGYAPGVSVREMTRQERKPTPYFRAPYVRQEPKLQSYFSAPYDIQGVVFESQLPSSSVVQYHYNTGIAEPSNPGNIFNGTQGLPIPSSLDDVAANLDTYDPRTRPMSSEEVDNEFDAFYKTPAGKGGKLYKTRNRRGRKSIRSKKSRKSRKARKHRRSRRHIA